MMLTLLKRYWLHLLILALLGIYGVVCYRTGYNSSENRHTARALTETRKALAEFITEAERLNGLSMQIQQQTDLLARQTKTHTVEYRTHEKLVPLPADCRPDAVRLRHIDNAIQDVNATIASRSDKTVPTN